MKIGQTFCGVTPASLEQARRRRRGSVSKWNKLDLKWWIGDRLPGVPYDDLVMAYHTAFAQWQAVCGLTFEQTNSSSEADFHVLARPIDGSSGVLAEHQLPNGNDQPLGGWFDTGERWDADGNVQPNEIDLLAVACHEFGHGIGLDHLSAGNLLAPTYDPRITKPQQGDINEAEARYGPTRKEPELPTANELARLSISIPANMAPGIYHATLEPE